MLNKKFAVIGSGFAGLSAASVLAASHHEVHVFEKNAEIGGRARQFSANGFTFDMGPSWYWMPDIIEAFFNRFNHSASDFFELKKLDPGFKVIFKQEEEMLIPADFNELVSQFENVEKGAGDKLIKFIAEAQYKYDVSIRDFLYQPGLSIMELVKTERLKDVFKLSLFSSFRTHVRTFFTNPKLIAIMEFPILFLGAMPKNTPALYSLMNYAGLKQGTYYPMGGFGKLVDAMKLVAQENGVTFHTNSTVTSIDVLKNKVNNVTTNSGGMLVDGVIGAADYHHVDGKLIRKDLQNYNEQYWSKKVFAPSSLLFYLGVNMSVDRLEHHNLFFDEDLDPHAKEIYETKKWPEKPLFYVCCPSKTDKTVAPEGMENLFILMPIAAGIEDTDEIREHYFHRLIKRLEKYTKSEIGSNIIYKRSYCVSDFETDYNAYKGNAYGLANTLSQTANLKPKIKNKKLNNMFYAGQLTVPGPGVPPSIISGQLAAQELLKAVK